MAGSSKNFCEVKHIPIWMPYMSFVCSELFAFPWCFSPSTFHFSFSVRLRTWPCQWLFQSISSPKKRVLLMPKGWNPPSHPIDIHFWWWNAQKLPQGPPFGWQSTRVQLPNLARPAQKSFFCILPFLCLWQSCSLAGNMWMKSFFNRLQKFQFCPVFVSYSKRWSLLGHIQ